MRAVTINFVETPISRFFLLPIWSVYGWEKKRFLTPWFFCQWEISISLGSVISGVYCIWLATNAWLSHLMVETAEFQRHKHNYLRSYRRYDLFCHHFLPSKVLAFDRQQRAVTSFSSFFFLPIFSFFQTTLSFFSNFSIIVCRIYKTAFKF